MTASLAAFLWNLHPAPSLEKKVMIELEMKAQTPTLNGMQWTFHPKSYLRTDTNFTFYIWFEIQNKACNSNPCK